MERAQVNSPDALRVGAFCLTAVAGTVAATESSARLLQFLLMVLITYGQFQLIRKTTRHRVPLVGVIVVVINIVGAAGYLYYRDIAQSAQVSARLPDSDDIYARAAQIFLIASVSFTFGGILVRRSAQVAAASLDLPTAIRNLPPQGLLAMAIAPLMMLLVAYGPVGLVHRDNYLQTTGPQAFTSLGSSLLPASIGILAFLLFDRERKALRVFVAPLLIIYALVIFSMGSRLLCLLPALLLFGFLQHPTGRGRPRRFKLLPGVFVFGAAVLLLQLPLTLRGTSNGAGLAPFFGRLVDDPSLLFAFNPGAILGNVLFAVPLTGSIATTVPSLPVHYFVTSVNPLPGFMTDWQSVHTMLAINGSTPFCGLGELDTYGVGYLVAYCAVAGMALSLLQRVSELANTRARVLLQVVGLGTAALLALNLIQYNLRSGTRLLYYFAALVIIALLTSRANDKSSVIVGVA